MLSANKWRITIYKGLKGLSDNAEVFDEVHVESDVELSEDQVYNLAVRKVEYLPRSHHVEILKIR